MSSLQENISAKVQYQQNFKRILSLWDVVIMTISTISSISGVFITIPLVLTTLGGLSWLSIILAGIVTVLICIIYAEIAATYPIAGGEYTWIARLWNNPLAFSLMCLILVQGAFGCGVLPLGIKDSLAKIWPPLGSSLANVIFIILCMAVACINVRISAWITGIFVAVEIMVVSAIIFLGFTHTKHFASAITPAHIGNLPHGSFMSVMSLAGIFTAIPIAFAGFAGFAGCTSSVYYAEEIIDFPRKIVKIMVISNVFIMIESSIACLAIIVHFTSLRELMSSDNPVQYFLSSVAGPTVTKIMNIAVVIAIFNALITATIQFGRLIYSTARDKTWPESVNRVLAYIEPRTGSPIMAIMLFGMLLIVITLLVPLRIELLTLGAGNLIIAIITIVTSLFLRKSGARSSMGFIMPGWPILPIIMTVILGLILISTFAEQKISLVIAAFILGLGITYYYVYLRSRKYTHWNLLEPIIESESN